jgi:translocation and assembly module TamA
MNFKPIHCLIVCGVLIVSATLANPFVRAKHDTAKKGPVNITISGIQDPAVLKNINSGLKTVQAIHLTHPITNDSIYSIYSNAPIEIKDAMQPYGYFNPTIQSSYTHLNGTWDMHFTITPGVRSTVTRIHIKTVGSGADDEKFLKIIQDYPLKQGDFFDLSKYNDGNNLLFEAAANRGYFDARMSFNKITVNLLNNTVGIMIEFNTGVRHRFGFTHFSQTPLNIRFLHKYMAYKEGDYYDNAKIQETQNNLSNSGYFSQTLVSPDVKKTINNITPMSILLQMRKRKEYIFGLGYGTDTQIRGTAGFKYRWVNSWGHYFDVLAQGSFVNNSLVASYNMPWPDPTKDLLSVKVGAGNMNVSSGTSNGEKVSLQYRHIFTNWTITSNLSYLNERYNMTNLPWTQANLLYPDVNASYYSTKNHINPDNALRFTTDVSGTPNFLSTTSGFFQARAESKGIFTFLNYEQIAARLAIGRTQIPSINNLPMSLQFLIGGSQTVRGYGYQSIGPGHNMTYGSFEFRQRIWKQLYVAGFYDFGTVTDGALLSEMNQSAGPSILYRSPIGVIQLSVPWRLIPHDIKPRFVFSMGPEL